MVTAKLLAFAIRRGRIPQMYKVGMASALVMYEVIKFLYEPPRKNYKPYSDTV